MHIKDYISIQYVIKTAKAFYEQHGREDRDMRKVLPSWAVDPWREAILPETRASGDQPTVAHTGA